MELVLLCLFGCMTFALIGVVVWLLFRTQAQLQQQAHLFYEREGQFLDRLAVKAGARPLSQPIVAEAPVRKAAPISDDDFRILQDRLSERVEVGEMTPMDAKLALDAVTKGEKTQAEFERELWGRQKAHLNGSVADIF